MMTGKQSAQKMNVDIQHSFRSPSLTMRPLLRLLWDRYNDLAPRGE